MAKSIQRQEREQEAFKRKREGVFCWVSEDRIDELMGLLELNALASKLAQKRQDLSALSVLAKPCARRLCQDRHRLFHGFS